MLRKQKKCFFTVIMVDLEGVGRKRPHPYSSLGGSKKAPSEFTSLHNFFDEIYHLQDQEDLSSRTKMLPISDDEFVVTIRN